MCPFKDLAPIQYRQRACIEKKCKSATCVCTSALNAHFRFKLSSFQKLTTEKSPASHSLSLSFLVEGDKSSISSSACRLLLKNRLFLVSARLSRVLVVLRRRGSWNC